VHDLAALAEKVIAADRASVARAISLVEDTRPAASREAATLLSLLGRSPRHGQGHRTGVTGPPGVGKSTLVNALIKHMRRAGRTVGVVAVDPSSKRSGGALLGDRARITVDPTDEGVFVRSLATGGEHGGLALAAPAIVWVLAAAYDDVIIETTGVGQTETDVEHVADTVVLVIQPGSGDTLQFLKAGIMEIPDLIVVNKSDLGALAERAASDVKAALHLADGSAAPSVVLVSATGGQGIETLVGLIDARRATERTATAARRQRGWVHWTLSLLVRTIGERGIEERGGRVALAETISRELGLGRSPPEIAGALDRREVFTR